MTAINPALEHTLAGPLQDVRDLATAGPVDTGPLAKQAFLFDLSDLDLVRIEGRDRQRFLHAMLSNDVLGLEVGKGRWATLNNLQGRTVADLRLLQLDTDRKEGALLALLEPGAGELLVDGLNPYIVAEKVFFEPLTSFEGWLLAGSGAGVRLQALGCELPPPELFAHREVSAEGCRFRVVRLDRAGVAQEEFLLLLDPSHREAILGGLDGVPRGDRTLLEAARIEGGQPRFGIDLTARNIPLEAGLKDRAIDFKKGCYIGQEVICRIDSMGRPARQLVRLQVDGDQPPLPGTGLYLEDKEVGYVTSSVLSVARGGVIGLGYVKKRHNEIGTRLCAGAGGSGPVVVVGEQV